jgi:putative DNA methylase
MTDVKTRKKLIEVALPLEAINSASAREKSIRHGHPSTLHLWWARRPLAAARAVIFAQMVDDPSTYVDTLLGVPETRRVAERELKKRHVLWEARTSAFAAATGQEAVAVPEPGPEPTLEDCAADIERQRLFRIIEELVLWENTTNELVLEKARAEIWQSWRRACADNAGHPRAAELFDRAKLPAFHDPFAGGGALPLEAQRLGLEAYASDLNPVAVLINKAMIEIPPKFAGRPPVNPASRNEARHGALRAWKGAQGLAEDVRYYGKWMREEAQKRIGHLYPKIEITDAMVAERPDLKPYVGRKLTAVAWLWARTVKSPNPAFRDLDVPLASTFMLSTKAGKEAYAVPILQPAGYRFQVLVGKPGDAAAAKAGTKLGRGSNFRCVVSGSPISGEYIKAEGQSGRMGSRLLAIVAEGDRGRIYLSPSEEHELIARSVVADSRPDGEVPARLTGGTCVPYGLATWGDLFTQRQLVALNCFSDLVLEVQQRARADALLCNLPVDPAPLAGGGKGAQAYADAVAVYLAFAISKLADRGSTICTWFTERDSTRNTFARQGIPMTWDYAELNTLLDGTGSFAGAVGWTAESLDGVASGLGSPFGASTQLSASSQNLSLNKVVSTDPPYYDNISYADLSDFFYVWLRRSLRLIVPELFNTLAVPKAEELVATSYRHGGRDAAELFFLNGMTDAMRRLAEQTHPGFPTTIYYAFKQSETDSGDGTASTGWETFLDAVIRAGFGLGGTWPMRTELGNRMIGSGTNALASSIILVCRPHRDNCPNATRRDFLNALKAELPEALRQLQRGNIAPVDLAQASIGPGMAVFTRYAKVVDAEGKTLSVREALALINAVLDEVLAEQEGDFDADSRFAIAWFEQFGFAEGEFGVADVLARAKVTSVAGLAEAGLLASRAGKVRLLTPAELPEGWDPIADPRLTVWEMVHHLIRVLESGGESVAGDLAAKLGARAEIARELAYRLYSTAERKKRAAEALQYNGLVQSWPEIMRLARDRETAGAPTTQADMFSRA